MHRDVHVYTCAHTKAMEALLDKWHGYHERRQNCVAVKAFNSKHDELWYVEIQLIILYIDFDLDCKNYHSLSKLQFTRITR